MTTLSTSILIDASPQKVWEILLDFKAYPSWNPFIQKIQFTDEAQENLEVLIAPPNGTAMTFKPQILSKTKDKEFAWMGKLGLKGLFDGHHSFILKETNGKTYFTQSEQFTGILVPLFKKSLHTKTLKGFELMNEAIKQRAEKEA